jgi:alkanesulfonate monooxygenase SsuD/methylene tetrahydromethanopterin reductase-like flavin-dependent oxidoreductase (luciferase family)
VTLKLVAQYGDMSNYSGSLEKVRHLDEVLRRHCETVGRDPDEIERTLGIGNLIIRDDPAEAQRVGEAAFTRNRVRRPYNGRGDEPCGTPEQVAEQIGPYLELGYRHLVADFASDFDEESMTRFATEVKPLLERVPAHA